MFLFSEINGYLQSIEASNNGNMNFLRLFKTTKFENIDIANKRT